MTTVDAAARTVTPKPQQDVLRIDLSANRWCKGDCATTHTILESTATQIVFDQFADKNGEGHEMVSRESGKYTFFLRIHNLVGTGLPLTMSAVEQCELERDDIALNRVGLSTRFSELKTRRLR